MVCAVAFSLFYGLFAPRIFDVQETEKPLVWRFHQFWFNFVGSSIGWAVGYYLWKRLASGGAPAGAIEFVLLVVAALGITGHLPLTLYGVAATAGKLKNSLPKP